MHRGRVTRLRVQGLAGRIAAVLRQRIVAGALKPGARLPDRQELTREFGTSLATVQLAVQQLVADGFLAVGARRCGTRVAARPPHLYHYKLLFPYSPDTRGEFWRVLRAEAGRMSRTTERQFSFFFGLGGHRDIGAYDELVAAVRTERVAGLIFASGAAEFQGTPVLDQPGIPRVAIAARHELPGMPKLLPDYDSFFARALDCLLARGRRRLAVLFGAAAHDDAASYVTQAWQKALAARALVVRPEWLQFVHTWSPLAARHCVRLLLQPGRAERPDGLILADDNFLTAATRGVRDSGVAVPDALTVVTIANFPAGVPAAVPVIRVGFDVRHMLDTLAGWVDLLRAGKRPPRYAKIAACVEDS